MCIESRSNVQMIKLPYDITNILEHKKIYHAVIRSHGINFLCPNRSQINALAAADFIIFKSIVYFKQQFVGFGAFHTSLYYLLINN